MTSRVAQWNRELRRNTVKRDFLKELREEAKAMRSGRSVIEEMTGREAQYAAKRGRQRIIADVQNARTEHAAGKTRALSIDEVMNEIES